MDLEIGKKLLQKAVIGIFLFIIAMQLLGLSLEPHASTGYTSFYFSITVVGFLVLLMMSVFDLKYGDVFSLPKSMKVMIVVIWIVFVVSVVVVRLLIFDHRVSLVKFV